MTNKDILKKLYTIVLPYRNLLAISMVTMVVYSLFTTAQAWILKPVIDEMFVKKDMNMLMLLPFGIVLIFLMKAVSYYVYTFLLEKVGQSIIRCKCTCWAQCTLQVITLL